MDDSMEPIDPPPELKLAHLLEQVMLLLARQDLLDRSIAEARREQHDLTARVSETTRRLRALEG